MTSDPSKTAVVTGASRGIGLAIVEALSADGFQVVAAARNPSERMRALAARSIALDLTEPDAPTALISEATSAFGRLDVLVNNLGAFHARTDGFAAVDDEQWQRTFETNLFSAVRAIRAALPHLLESEGAIINVGSINARVPQPPVVDYAAAKAALLNLSKTLAGELGAQGVRVNTVSPGPTRTPAWEAPGEFGDQLASATGRDLDTFLAGFAEMAGLTTGRMTEPAEVAAVVSLLASDRARNINGADIIIDGGQHTAL